MVCQSLSRFLAKFGFGNEAGFSLNGSVNNHNIRMFASVNQPPDFYFDISNSSKKVTVWLGRCGNGDMLGPFFFNRNVNGPALSSKQSGSSCDDSDIREPVLKQ